jgi:hypothetical protein
MMKAKKKAVWHLYGSNALLQQTEIVKGSGGGIISK